MARHGQVKPPISVEPPAAPRPDWAVDPDLRGSSTPAPRKHRHIFRWVFLAVQILFLVWIITGVSSSSTKSCNSLVGQALTTCQSASHAGTAIGVGLVIGLWMAVDVILAITWLIFRKRG